MSTSLHPDGSFILASSATHLPEVSVVVPIHNEYDSLPHLVDAIAASLQSEQLHYEIICIDDGSTDHSGTLLKQLVQARSDLRAVILRRNYGQTAAMAAGFSCARGRVIAFSLAFPLPLFHCHWY